MINRRSKIAMVLSLVFVIAFSALAYAGPQDTSSTTGTNLIARARIFLDEATEKNWLDTTLLQFLNDGTVDLAAKTLCYQTTENIALVADTVEYTPSANYIKLVAVILNTADGISTGLKMGGVNQRGSDESENYEEPKFFYEFAGKVGVFPAYSSVTTETITLYLARRPAPIAAGDNVPTPLYLDKALVYYIVAHALMADHRPVEASNYFNLYGREINRYRQDFIGADINENPETTP